MGRRAGRRAASTQPASTRPRCDRSSRAWTWSRPPRGLPRVLLAHARDDDAVPFAHSERLAAVLAPPSQFICLSEGGHHGPGRSPFVARATIDWVLANSEA